MLPRIIVHSAVSIDGRLDGFAADLGAYYGLINRWHEDATLVGAGTVLRATQIDAVDEAPAGAPDHNDDADNRPLLVVPDSRGRVRTWQAMRRAGYWRDCMALVSRATRPEYLEYLRAQRVHALIHGDDHVDLRAALEELSERFGVQTVRVDSGGTLIGALLRAGLVDDISLLVHPAIVGSASHGALFRPDVLDADQPILARLESAEQLEGGLVWMRYSLTAAAGRTSVQQRQTTAASPRQREAEV